MYFYDFKESYISNFILAQLKGKNALFLPNINLWNYVNESHLIFLLNSSKFISGKLKKKII